MPRTTYDFDALTLREKASLTPEEIRQDFLPYRMMQEGVAAVLPPLFIPVPERPEVPFKTVYELIIGGAETGVAFENPDAIEAILALKPVRIDGDWTLSYHHKMANTKGIVGLGRGNTAVQGVQVVPFQEWEQLKAWGQEAKSAAEKNEQAVKDHRRATESIEDMLEGLMESWRRAVQTVGRFRGILETKANYERMAGDPEVARKFLLNTFSEAEVAEAEAFAQEEAGDRKEDSDGRES